MIGRRSAYRRRLGWVAVAGALGCLAFAAWAPPAHAGPLVASAPSCAEQPLSKPFLRWLDPLDYTLAPNGGFEDPMTGWSLTGGAATVAGNESFYVRSAGDTRSLKLPAGSTATSPTICVGLDHPVLRLFVRNTGSLLSTLRVDVLFEDAAGAVHSITVGTTLGSASWQPTLPMPVVANLLPLLPEDRTPIALRFVPQGRGGDWRIDDVYVDPRRRS